MKTAFFCFSSRGEATARRLEEAGTVVRVESGTLASTVASWWSHADALVFVASLGIAVRAVAPHLSDKAEDPAVLVVTEDGKTVLPVTGAHLGGGRELAERLAGLLGVEPLLTTSSDRAGFVAPDLLASRWGWLLLGRDALAATNGALIETGALSFWTDVPELLPPLPAEYAAAEEANAALLISPRAHSTAKKRVQLVPPCIVAGMGCRRGASAKTLRSVLNEALRAQGLLPEAIREIRTVEEKMDEPGLIELAASLDVPLLVVPREVILSMEETFSASAATKHLDLPGVAEPCAASAGKLLGRRIATEGVTVAFAIAEPRREPFDPARRAESNAAKEASLEARTKHGALFIIGTGPGAGGSVTIDARQALEEADAIVGYALYVDLLPQEWLHGKRIERYSMGEEEKRVERAVSLAEEGNVVALLSGGDPVLFGLAGLALRTAHGRVPAKVFPGVTAAQAAGALLGAPYVNGVALLSLSDYLQPWSAVLRALEGAALSGLTVALYNPVKRDLEEKLREVRRVFSGQGYETGYLVRDAGRDAPSVRKLPLAELCGDSLDMRTLILLPGNSVEEFAGLLLDRRGYRREADAQKEETAQ